MTVIAAFDDGNTYWIASDSVGSAGNMQYELGSKLIKKGDYVIGFSWSYRVADIIRECKFLPEAINGMKDLRLLRDIIKALITKDGAGEGDGQSNGSNGSMTEHPVDIVIISPSGMYTIETDYQIHKVMSGYAMTGSGTEVAAGALYSCKKLNVHGKDAVRLAVTSAMTHVPTCGGKCHIKSVEKR